MTLADKFGAARSRQMSAYLLDFAARAGVAGLVVPARTHNTQRALALAEWARDQGALHPVRRRLMDAYWRRGLDVEADAVLAGVAREAGLDPEAALRGIAAPGVLARVAAMGREAAAAGVTGIPTFDVGGERVVGAQPYEILAAAVARQGGRPR